MAEAHTFSILVRLIGAAALLLQLGGALAADTIKIAFMTALSGTLAFQGEEQLKIFNAAADAINAQGGVLGGRKVEIVAFDNEANPQESLVILKQVTDQDIRYVTATVSSVAHALSDAIAKYNARNPDRPILFSTSTLSTRLSRNPSATSGISASKPTPTCI